MNSWILRFISGADADELWTREPFKVFVFSQIQCQAGSIVWWLDSHRSIVNLSKTIWIVMKFRCLGTLVSFLVVWMLAFDWPLDKS